MQDPRPDDKTEEKHLRFQFGIVFVLTFPLTFLVFPPMLWLLTGGSSTVAFWPWLIESYANALVPAYRIIGRGLAISVFTLGGVFLVLKYYRFSRLLFVLGCAVAIFVAGFIAVYTSGLHNGDGSLIPNRLSFSFAAAVVSAVCAAIVAGLVVLSGISDDETAEN